MKLSSHLVGKLRSVMQRLRSELSSRSRTNGCPAPASSTWLSALTTATTTGDGCTLAQEASHSHWKGNSSATTKKNTPAHTSYPVSYCSEDLSWGALPKSPSLPFLGFCPCRWLSRGLPANNIHKPQKSPPPLSVRKLLNDHTCNPRFSSQLRDISPRLQ